MNFGSMQGLVLFALGLMALGITVWALVDAATTRGDAFVAAGKRTKGFWVAVTGVAAALVFVTFPDVLSIFGLISLVAAAIYLTDVRPAVRSLRGRGGGGTHMGPYGPW
jgi:hypothetical protein